MISAIVSMLHLLPRREITGSVCTIYGTVILVCFLGEKNRCYLPISTYTTYNLVKEAHPNQQYSWTQIPNYGHLDCIYGRDAVHDVYPHILKALDAHAHDSLHLNDSACRHVFKAVNSLMCKSGMNRLG